MAYGSVHIPAGCTVKVGDSVGALTDLGVLKGDASIEITYDLVEVLGSKAESLVDIVKNMRANSSFELYQLHLPNLEKLLDGVATVTSQAGTLQSGVDQVVASGAWAYDRFIPFENQNGDGSQPTVNSVTGGTDGALTEDTDYFIMKDQDGIWGLYVIDSVNLSTESQTITINTDYTPAASKTLKMGAKSASLTAKIVEFSKTISSKVFRARLWKAKNESGITLAFPDSAGEEPASIPVSLIGRIDEDRSDGEQLIEIYDEIGLTT